MPVAARGLVLFAIAFALAGCIGASAERQSVGSFAVAPWQTHPTDISNCTNPDDVDEDLLKCYVIEEEDEEELGECKPAEPADLEPSDRCDCSEFLDDESILPYYNFHYCKMRKAQWLSVIILFVWVIFLFYLESIATERFLVPILNDVSTALRLSHNVAGVTLLALANGAPDVFTSIAAFNSDGASGLGLGSLLGTGMFLATFVFGWVANVKEFTAHRRPLIRDLLFYAGGIGMLYYCYSQREVKLWHAFVLVGWYIIYVLVVVLGRIIYQRRKAETNPFPPAQNDDEEETHVHVHSGHVQSGDAHTPLIGYEYESIQGKKYYNDGSFSAQLREFVGWDERGWLRKLILPLEFPFLLAMRLTIPMVGEETWSRTFNALSMAFAPHLLVWAFEQSDAQIGPLNIHAWGAIFTPLFGLLTYWLTTDRVPESKLGYGFFCFVSFLMSFIWPFKIADELVDLLTMFGVIVKLSGGIIGVTIVSIGNSIQDVFADITLAKDKPRMAAAGCIGGPVFNLLVGVGAAFLIRTVKDYPDPLELLSDKQANIGFLAIAVAVAFALFVLPCLFRFRVSRLYGRILMAVYVVYLFFAILMEADVIKAL